MAVHAVVLTLNTASPAPELLETLAMREGIVLGDPVPGGLPLVAEIEGGRNLQALFDWLGSQTGVNSVALAGTFFDCPPSNTDRQCLQETAR